MDINVKISSDMNIEYTKPNPKLDYIEVELIYFPIEQGIQKILGQEISSDPIARITKEENSITYRWENDRKTMKFGLDTNVRIENDFKRINKKIKFPLDHMDAGLLDYLKVGESIDINDEIINKATEIVEGETDYYMAVYKIADWVRNNVKYEKNELTEDVIQKSSWVLKNKIGVCDELTNLFISMLRAVNIPCKFVSGITYTDKESEDIKHSWAEVYFPGYGWIPFDVTFGQYGWISPNHVKLADSIDSSTVSVNYKWKSYGIDVKTKELNIEAEIINKMGIISPQSFLSIEPLKKRVGFGSYIPLEVIVKNLQDYYLPLTIQVSKAPGLLDNSGKHIILKPDEEKRLYWILKIPSNLDKRYIYTSDIGVRTSFGAVAEDVIRYSEEYNKYSLEWAKSKIEELKEGEEKIYLPNLDLTCDTDKEVYYSNESVIINCYLANKGNTNLDNLRVCLKNDCKIFDLKISKDKEINFSLTLSESEKVKISAETDDMIKSLYQNIKIVQIPEVKIDINPKSTNYKDKEMFKININSYTEIYGLDIKIKDIGELELGELAGEKEIPITIKGSKITDNKLEFGITYKDELNKEYKEEKIFPIEVKNIPWYGKVLMFFRGLI